MTSPARVIRIKIEEGKAGLFYATSPDLRGLLVAEPTIDDLEAAIPEAIAELILASTGEQMVVTKAQDADPDLYPWVAIPAVIAAKLMESAH